MILKELKEDLKDILNQEYRIEPLATGIYVYVEHPEEVSQDSIKELVKKFKKRVYIRKDPAYLRDFDEKKTKQKILKLLPKDAQVISIDFSPDFSEVFIRVKFPRYTKDPELVQKILEKTGWYPIFVREPQLPSAYFDSLYLYKIKTDRKGLLKKVGKRILERADDEVKWITATMLGGFREIGRSSLLIESNVSKVIIDMGVHPSPPTPEDAYPMINLIRSLESIDAIVISHAHTDHVCFLPYLFKAGYEGPVYMTKPTLDLAVLLQHDYISISKKTTGESIYDKKDIRKMVNHTILLDYGEVIDISKDMKLTMYNAGHILGSSIVHLHIGEGKHNVIFSGDIKYDRSIRLFDPAYTKFPRAETVFIESTYGSQKMPPREESEKRLVEKIKETVARGGKVLIPAFAVGRSQEVIVTLFENADKDWNIPVYIDGMVYEASSIHSAYPEYLKASVREKIISNDSPFNWEYLKVVKTKDKSGIISSEPAVIIAPSGMLTGGPSVEYLKLLAEDERNTLIFIGYQSPGSLGSKIQQGMKVVPIKEDKEVKELKINMEVTTIEGFSGHSDRDQLLAWLGSFAHHNKVRRVYTMHGEQKTIMKFTDLIRRKLRIPASAPMNMERRRLR